MSDDELLERETTQEIIGAFFDVYNKLGFGFLEHVYSLALERELVARGRSVAREVSVQVFYDGEPLTSQRVDMIVDGTVLVENKSSANLPPIAQRQTLNYLSATSLQVGLLLHFGPLPRFYRLVHTRKAIRRADPADIRASDGRESRPTPP